VSNVQHASQNKRIKNRMSFSWRLGVLAVNLYFLISKLD